MFAVISDVVWQAMIGAVVTIVLAWMQMKTQHTVKQTAKRAAVEVAHVKKTLEETTAVQEKTLDRIAVVGQATHDLCNSAMGEQKRLLAATARAKANDSGNSADEVAAEQAEKMFKDHQERQAFVDAKAKVIS